MKSEIFIRTVSHDKTVWLVEVTRKGVKHLRISVTSNGTVRLSVPMRCPISQIDTFLNQNKFWIAKTTAKQQKIESEREASAKDGIRILGKKYFYEIAQGRKDVCVDDDKITICCADGAIETAKRDFDRWWNEEAKKYLTAEFYRLYEEVFMDRLLHSPELQVKRAKSYWGNCRKDKNMIRLNSYLYQADADCIRYVILHELCHLYHTNHGKQFYKLLLSICHNAPVLRNKLLQTTHTNLWTDF